MFGGGAGEAGEGGLANGAPARSEPSSASVTDLTSDSSLIDLGFNVCILKMTKVH